MLEHLLHEYLPILIHLIEIIGIFIIVTGAIKAFKDYLIAFFKDGNTSELRHDLGTAMVTGLEFKMAAEILRTVIVRTWQEVAMLGAIVVLREILFFFINKDIKEHNRQHTEEISENKKITGIKFERE
ncbi:MAG: DUF1622 domain-containing protein [Oscillospiraceae bacterium]|nr:DUF1622 domain-containing protein [Oscillospiraceae bacterium]MBR6518388.1 DUF1622 domain-containing protein [Oscillospiraceae bacterium]